jgi:NADPH-dependent 2,4-dienoyl-CoA reductase/sulfur reductase-like enzyme
MKHVVVAGGSIAGATAASALRARGWAGRITLLTEERVPPYSRVPLSKGVLTGALTPDSVLLPPLPQDVELHLGRRAVALDPAGRVILLADGSEVSYDGLVVATGSRPRRLARDGQRGELVVRTLDDAAVIAKRVASARSAVVIGGGFLGMEISSTLRARGLAVTVVSDEPPLRRLVGRWLADFIVGAAVERGVEFVISPGGASLVGEAQVTAGATADGRRRIEADVVISAVGDEPNVDWLRSSGLPLAGGLVVDDRCRVAAGIVAAGDVATRELAPGVYRRTPHWTNAVLQGRAAAVSLLDPDAAPYVPDPYFWTEQFGLDVKIVGELPLAGQPVVIEGDLPRSALLQWHRGGEPVAAVAINCRVPVTRLKRLARQA